MSITPQSWELVSRIFERVIINLEAARQSNIDNQTAPAAPSRFDSSKVPSISVYNYLARIHQYADCSDSCYTLAFIYIDRLLQRNPGFILSQRCAHRLILTSIVLAIKYSDDIYADNGIYGKIGGVSLAEINTLEAEMLEMLDFNLYVHPHIYQQYTKQLEHHYQQIISEETSKVAEEEPMTDCLKPIASVQSMGSIKTVPSSNDMTEA